jgi:hypothetical protein
MASIMGRVAVCETEREKRSHAEVGDAAEIPMQESLSFSQVE